MPGRRRAAAGADAERSVQVRRVDGETFWVTPEAARAIVHQGGHVIGGGAAATVDGGFSQADAAVAKATVDLQGRIADLEQETAEAQAAAGKAADEREQRISALQQELAANADEREQRIVDLEQQVADRDELLTLVPADVVAALKAAAKKEK